MRDDTKTMEFYKKVYAQDSYFIENDKGRIQRIIDLRQKNLSEIPDEQRGKVAQLQQYYALKVDKSKAEQDALSNNALSAAFNSLFKAAKKGGK